MVIFHCYVSSPEGMQFKIKISGTPRRWSGFPTVIVGLRNPPKNGTTHIAKPLRKWGCNKNKRSCMIMYDHVWSCMIMYDHVWSCMIMYHHVLYLSETLYLDMFHWLRGFSPMNFHSASSDYSNTKTRPWAAARYTPQVLCHVLPSCRLHDHWKHCESRRRSTTFLTAGFIANLRYPAKKNLCSLVDIPINTKRLYNRIKVSM